MIGTLRKRQWGLVCKSRGKDQWKDEPTVLSNRVHLLESVLLRPLLSSISSSMFSLDNEFCDLNWDKSESAALKA